MLSDLDQRLGRDGACMLLGCPMQSWRRWCAGIAVPNAVSVRGIWLAWCLLLHPDRIPTLFDVATWGRFIAPPPSVLPWCWDI